MTTARVAIPYDEIAALCRRWHIAELALFGSVLREDFRPDSDIDVLVTFEPGHVPGFGMITLEDELSALLGGHRVDVVTAHSLNHRIRAGVLVEAEQVYGRD